MTTALSSSPLRLSSLDWAPLAGRYRLDRCDVQEAPPIEVGDPALDVALALGAQLDADGAAVVRMPWLASCSTRSTTPAALTALLRLQNRLARRIVELLLEAADLLNVDQRKALHGRMPVGSGQEELPPASRRLLKHGFGRARRLTCSSR